MRRWWLASGLALGTALTACGAKVAVDPGGAGGGTASSSSSSSTTSSGCTGVVCMQPGPSCVCQGTCADQALQVGCENGECTCSENGIKIFNCAATGSNPCDISAGCCSAAFFGGGI